jgi:hypothetical protein
VAFERLYVITDEGEVLLTTHEVLDFDRQTVHFPKIGTTLTDKATEDHLSSAVEDVELIDTIHYENLIPGKEYTATGTLMDKETGKAILDEKGVEITWTVKFIPETPDW